MMSDGRDADAETDVLFRPVKLGAWQCPNRLFMAPLTRGRADRAGVPTSIMAQYYRQRSSAGLILSEATGISREGLGWCGAPGLWNDAQVEGWRPVTAGVREEGGRILAQLWHMGRLVHPDFNDGKAPVSASATQATQPAHTYTGKQPNVVARALPVAEIPRLVDDFARAARNAMAAGFDGVELHAANGYLIDQFLRSSGNLREDDYGGTIENRARLLRELVVAVGGEIGADRVAVRLSPNGEAQGINDPDPEPLFAHVATMLAQAGIAFIELREPGYHGTFGKADREAVAPVIAEAFGGPVVLNSDYDPASAAGAVASGVATAVSFGRPFISNPDLPARVRNGAPIAPWDQRSWYTSGPEGYVDYPGMSVASPRSGLDHHI